MRQLGRWVSFGRWVSSASPLRRASSSSRAPRPPLERTPSFRAASRQVFANAEVNLEAVEVFGFDYDYTLATYSSTLQHLIYDTAKGYLLDRLAYPDALQSARYDPTFCIRGLVFDRLNGTLLKLSHRQIVTPGAVFRGRRRLTDAEVVELYTNTLHLPHSYIRKYCSPVPDMFALAEGCLLSDVMQLADDLGIPHDPYWIHQDVRKAVEHTHISGAMHGAIKADVAQYIRPNPDLRKFLECAAGANKRLFLLTNSPLDFVEAGMTFLVGSDWMDLFDVSIFEAGKPRWFSGEKPFRSLDATRSFVKWGTVQPDDVLVKGRALVGGSVQELLRLTGWGKEGARVLYFGDHVFADLAEPARQTGWTTGAIVRELEHEIKVLRSPRYVELHRRGEEIDKMLNSALSRAHLEELDAQRRHNFREKGELFNPNFGSIFNSRGDASSFAFNVRRISDLYCSRLENFLEYPMDYRFYPQRATHMPHTQALEYSKPPPPPPNW
jgi:HAD superfamily 5'-nucleotidase-like hydrolase